MSDCQNIEPDLSALIDGELPGERQAEVIEHVDHCPKCAQRVAELQKLVAGIAALPQAQPAPQFLADVRRQLVPQSTWVDTWFRPVWWKLPIEALAVIAIVAGGMSWLRPAPAPVLVAQAPAVRARILSEEPAQEVPAAADRRALAMAAPAQEKVSNAESLPGQPAELGGARAELPETLVIRGDSVVAVRLRVENLAKDLNGRVENTTPSNAFLVYLPKSKVAFFRRQVTTAKPMMSYAAAGNVEPMLDQKPTPAAPEPVVGVEVIVEP